MKKFILLFFISLVFFSFTSVAMEDEAPERDLSKKRTLEDGESDSQSSPKTKKRRLNEDGNPEKSTSQTGADESLPSFALLLVPEERFPAEEVSESTLLTPSFVLPDMWWTNLFERERLFEYTYKNSRESPFSTRGTTFYVPETSRRKSEEREIDWSQLDAKKLQTVSFEEWRDAEIATSNYPKTPIDPPRQLIRRDAFYEAETGDQTISTSGFDHEKALNGCWRLLPDPKNFQ